MNIDCYLQKMSYKDLMDTKNKKITNEYAKNKQKSKYITKENQQTTQKRKTRKDQRKSSKTLKKEVIKWQ